MGLRKISEDGNSFMYTHVKVDSIQMILLQDNSSAFCIKLGTETDAVKKWCRNLQKSPEEYVALLQSAVETGIVTYSDGNGVDKKDVFEIQEDSLVWKQFFPEKKVYGRRGKFSLEEMKYEDAIKEVLSGAIGDLEAKSNTVQSLTDDLEKKSRELQKAKDLTAKSVMEKETFEKEIYGKCISLINAKKLRIRQLMSGQASSSGQANTAGRGISQTATSSSSQVSKPSKSSAPDSDGYSSDTDVDAPDADEVDTDEETNRIATQKRKITGKMNLKPSRILNDSQDGLFNNSLEAELYSADVSKKQKVANESNGQRKKDTTERKNGGKNTYESSLNSSVGGSNRSVFDDIF